eukprot:2002784-Rhodomonas_salina.2
MDAVLSMFGDACCAPSKVGTVATVTELPIQTARDFSSQPILDSSSHSFNPSFPNPAQGPAQGFQLSHSGTSSGRAASSDLAFQRSQSGAALGRVGQTETSGSEGNSNLQNPTGGPSDATEFLRSQSAFSSGRAASSDTLGFGIERSQSDPFGFISPHEADVHANNLEWERRQKELNKLREKARTGSEPKDEPHMAYLEDMRRERHLEWHSKRQKQMSEGTQNDPARVIHVQSFRAHIANQSYVRTPSVGHKKNSKSKYEKV